ncbi:MAG TPA: tetratricopeptide repeat protein [Acidobacteriaceae bacterium]|jgi:tetratricopeptide (TPR) repeat protein|nr:tetratricopeptide repeat protein [Acidobacteriaceae bacterium]
MRVKSKLWLALLSLAVALSPALARAQDTGKIHGHTQDPGKVPIPNAQIQLSNDGKNVQYTFTTDANGDYTGSGIAPGTYFVGLGQNGKIVDRFPNVKITAGGDTTQDFDLSSPAYLNSLPPETRKQIEAAVQQNAQISKANQNIAQLNGMLKDANADIQQKKFDDAANLMQQATQLKPDAAALWLTLGDAQNGQKKYDDAITSFKKALDVDTASKKPVPSLEAEANSGLGEAYGSTNKIPDAQAAYDNAAKLLPADAARFYFNEAVIMNRLGQADATVAAADKAIAADPTKPIPYYLKGQALITKATVDPKTQKITAPPGCAEAYQKYLDLDPTGQFANDAKAVLQQIGKK